MTVTDHADHSDLDALTQTLDAIARAAAYGSRTPLLHSPADSGLAFEEFSFPSSDGTALEAWFIPSPGSDRVVVCAHAFGFNRAGYPSHLEPWKSTFGAGNDYDIDFIPDYRILHDAGYHVLAFDFRNFGLSAPANGGVQSAFRFEARDMVGALQYLRNRADTTDLKVGIFARCMGADATFRAIFDDPQEFSDVRCLVAPLLLSPRVILEEQLAAAGMAQHADEIDRRQRLLTSVSLADASPLNWAAAVDLPTLTYGVREDHLVREQDLQSIYEAIAAQDKDLFWIEDTTARWDGYTWFQRHPQRILDWLDAHMS
jgi:pimeloyl-ACP methyl ester carboxylesterase